MINVRRVLAATTGNLAIWIAAGLFATSEFHRRSIVMGGVAPWNEVLDVQLCTALIWAAYTPFVVLLAQHFRLRQPHLLRNSLIVVALLPDLAVLRAALGGVILNLGEHQPISLGMVKLSIGIRTHRDIAILAAVFFISNLVDAQREAAAHERQRMRAQTLLTRTELDDLRRRLQPQFAVRMLRHIGSVLRETPDAADALIVTLGGILRRSMGRESGEQIPLADELEHLDRCLDLCRAGGRLPIEAHYVAGDDVLACRIPALALEPAIEAAVLDLTSSGGGAVEVCCARERDELRVDVRSSTTSGAATTTLRIAYQEGT